jgi:hypothetical protein
LSSSKPPIVRVTTSIYYHSFIRDNWKVRPNFAGGRVIRLSAGLLDGRAWASCSTRFTIATRGFSSMVITKPNGSAWLPEARFLKASLTTAARLDAASEFCLECWGRRSGRRAGASLFYNLFQGNFDLLQWPNTQYV